MAATTTVTDCNMSICLAFNDEDDVIIRRCRFACKWKINLLGSCGLLWICAVLRRTTRIGVRKTTSATIAAV